MSLAWSYDFLDAASRREPASVQTVADIEKELALSLPEDYKEFLRFTDGYAGPIGEGYIDLFAAQQIAEMQRGYEVEQNVPGFLLIGSNGGGEAFGFDKRTHPWKVAMLPFIVMDWKDSIFAGNTFADFLNRQLNGEDLFASVTSAGKAS